MLFIIALILSIRLLYLEYTNYGKMVPFLAITKDTPIEKKVSVFIQRFATCIVLSDIYSFFSNFNNFFANIISFILIALLIYFGMIVFFLTFRYLIEIFIYYTNASSKNKPYE